MAKRRWLAAIALGLVVAGCSSGEANRRFPVPPAPAEVRQAIAANFPDDGKVHVIANQGTFVITPKTWFCYTNGGLGTEVVDSIIKDLHQPESYNDMGYRENGQLGQVEWCQRRFRPVLSDVSRLPNSIGKPFKIVLSVWQGDVAHGGAVWVAGIDSRLDPKNRDTWGKLPFRYGGPKIEYAMERDGDLLNHEFPITANIGAQK